jgi:two-component system NarL family response regulator
MLTISDEEEDLYEAIRAGASGYLLRDIPLDEVAGAVRALIT